MFQTFYPQTESTQATLLCPQFAKLMCGPFIYILKFSARYCNIAEYVSRIRKLCLTANFVFNSFASALCCRVMQPPFLRYDSVNAIYRCTVFCCTLRYKIYILLCQQTQPAWQKKNWIYPQATMSEENNFQLMGNSSITIPCWCKLKVLFIFYFIFFLLFVVLQSFPFIKTLMATNSN